MEISTTIRKDGDWIGTVIKYNGTARNRIVCVKNWTNGERLPDKYFERVPVEIPKDEVRKRSREYRDIINQTKI